MHWFEIIMLCLNAAAILFFFSGILVYMIGDDPRSAGSSALFMLFCIGNLVATLL